MTPDQSIASPNAAPPPPRITSVTYRHLKTHRGRYENSAVEASAEVPGDADPSEVLHNLQTWVRAQLADEEARADAFEKLEQLNDRIRWKQQDLAKVEQKLARVLDAIGESKVLIKVLVREGESGAALLLAAAQGKPWLVQDIKHELATAEGFQLTQADDTPVTDQDVPF